MTRVTDPKEAARINMVVTNPKVRELAAKLCQAITDVAHDIVEPPDHDEPGFDDRMDEVLGVIHGSARIMAEYVRDNA